MPEIIPAIIAKSFNELAEKIKLVEPYVSAVQLDIMDGVFVNNTTWPYNPPTLLSSFNPPLSPFERGVGGLDFIDNLNKLETNLFLEAHLMVAEPEKILDEWLASKVGRVIVHWEAINKIDVIASPAAAGRSNPVDGGKITGSPRDLSVARDDKQEIFVNLIKKTHQAGKQFGIALNPETPIEFLEPLIDELDVVLLMSVNPGFTGQEFIPDTLAKIQALRQKHPDVKIEVDGGINLSNVKEIIEAGADYFAVGSAIWRPAADVARPFGASTEEILLKFKSICK